MMTLASSVFLALVLLFSSERAAAQVDVYEFETLEQEQRFRQLSNDFRCPMCQNANLSSSPGGVAADLRREIARMIIEGRTDTEIEQFMLSRYGDFVLYRPRLTAKTVLLWFGPVLFLLLGGWVTYSIVRRSAGKSDLAPAQNNRVTSAPVGDVAEKTVEISTAERERLNRLLAAVASDTTADNSDR